MPHVLALALILAAPGADAASTGDSFYALSAPSLEGRPTDFEQYAGKVTLVVNVASKCGFTPQYAGLESLYEELEGKGFVILGFPSNDFGGQEPGSAEEIASFCKRNYGVTFPMFSKVVTKPGPEQSPIYSHLGRSGSLPTWNFCKYLIGKDGRIVAFFDSNVTPESEKLRSAIAEAMAE